MLGPALRIVDGNAGVLFLNDSAKRFVQGQVAGQGENVRARHHDFTYGDVIQFQRVVDHLFLHVRDLPELAAGGDDQFQFVRRVHCATAHLARSKKLEHEAA